MGNKKVITAAVSMAALVAAIAPVRAVTVYPPVQFQFGQHGELYYGGTQSGVSNSAAGPQMVAGVYTNSSYTPLYFHPEFGEEPERAIYSDYRPGVDVKQYGYTINDARNEAYANAPTFFAKGPRPAEQAVDAPEMVPVTVPSYTPGAKRTVRNDPRSKAIPLLDWAKGAHARGQKELVEALLAEAAKSDPKATAALRREFEKAGK
jgi:hypothetical protein